jgi:N-acetylmuramoyl-L-alanine amidase
MRRNVIIVAVLASLTLASTSFAALPFGRFGGRADGVGAANALNGVVGLQGWALDDEGVRAVDILVDGVVDGRAIYGRSRPGVLAMYPGYPNADGAGYAYYLDTTHYLNGTHTVQPRVKSISGEISFLSPKVYQFFNDVHSLIPFGRIDFPQQHAELIGNCDIQHPRIYSVVDGLALDVGIQPEDTGVGYVELMIDRALWTNTRTGCYNSAATGGLSDCYGLPSFLAEQAWPGVKDAPHAGYRFVLDVGALVGSGLYTRGSHLLTIRAGDHADQDANIAEIPVFFGCAEDKPNHGSLGEIVYPVRALLYGGVITIKGWALDLEGVLAVDVYIDGTFAGQATYGLTSPATVQSRHPSYPGSAFAGWSFNYDTTKLANGHHSIQVKVRDFLLADYMIGEFDIRVGNWVP